MTAKVPAKRTISSIVYDTGGRRFVLALLTLFSANVLVWFMKISGEVWGLAMGSVVAVFVAGITVQKIKAGGE